MDGEYRRNKILERLENDKKPISASSFAKEFGVSRQIIVGDVALMRAGGIDIIATNSGYILDGTAKPVVLKLKHKTEDLFDVICTIVDEGAGIKSVFIKHNAYGTIEAVMNINSRFGAKSFYEKILDTGEKSIGELTHGIHYYNVFAENQLILLRVQKALNEKGYLVK